MPAREGPVRYVQLQLQNAISADEVRQLWDDAGVAQDARVRTIPDDVLMSHRNARRLPKEGSDEIYPFDDFAWHIKNIMDQRGMDCRDVMEADEIHIDITTAIDGQPLSLRVDTITGVTEVRAGENRNVLGRYTPRWPPRTETLYDWRQARIFLRFLRSRVEPFLRGAANAIDGSGYQEWAPL
jgi:hypothetical protein